MVKRILSPENYIVIWEISTYFLMKALPAAGEQVPHPEDQEVGRGLQQVLPPRLEPQGYLFIS